MQSKMTIPLFLAICAAVAFDLAPIFVGDGMMLHLIFGGLVVVLVVLSAGDRRAWAYGTVLTVCNPVNSIATAPYSVLLLAVALVLGSRSQNSGWGHIMRQLWWRLLALTLVAAAITLPTWGATEGGVMTSTKMTLCHLGYIVMLPLLLASTMERVQDGVRLIMVLLFTAIGIQALFYFAGERGTPDSVTVAIWHQDFFLRVGKAFMNYNRTQVCIILAALVAGSFGLGLGLLRLIQFPIYAAAAIGVFMVMQLASTGSAAAMAMGLTAGALGYLAARRSAKHWVLAIGLSLIAATALTWAVFSTDNLLAKRIEMKMQAQQIDRIGHWTRSIDKIMSSPVGRGWTLEVEPRVYCHNDFFVYFLSYGWPAGILYFTASMVLLATFARHMLQTDLSQRYRSTLLLAGGATLVVYIANSITDMLSANVAYYETVWAVILVAATMECVGEEDASPAPQMIAAGYYPAAEGAY